VVLIAVRTKAWTSSQKNRGKELAASLAAEMKQPKSE
jgi:hypothetical protein